MEISLTKLRQVLAVARQKSFSRAATELGMTQPALSRNIASIEARYGVKIFDRGRFGAALTSAGALMVAEAEDLLRSARTLDHNLKLYGDGTAGKLMVGLAPAVASLVSQQLGQHLLRELPQFKLQLLIRPPDVLQAALLNEEIELFVSPGHMLEPTDELRFETVGTLSATCVVRRGHPLEGRAKISMSDLCRWPLLGPVDWSSRTNTVAGAFICDDFHIMRELVQETDSVLLCPTKFVCDDIDKGTLARLDLADRSFDLSELICATIRGRRLNPLSQTVLRLCREIAADA